VSRREYHRLANPSEFWNVLLPIRLVDSLSGYSLDMWGMLTEIIREWYGISIPKHVRSEWGPPIVSPLGARVEMCLDRHAARRLQEEVCNSSYDPALPEGRISAFGGYGADVRDEHIREQEGMAFLARQAEHIPDLDHFVIVVSVAQEAEW
jgi:hypothetical protein